MTCPIEAATTSQSAVEHQVGAMSVVVEMGPSSAGTDCQAWDPTRRRVEHRSTPIGCIYEPSTRMFRVTRSRGNTLHSGGYGVALPLQGEGSRSHHRAPDEDASLKAAPEQTATYLFIEEVIVLYRQGLLEAMDEHKQPYDSQELYQMMQDLELTWPVFLVYAHLRQQTYRVVRYSAARRSILSDLSQYPSTAPRRVHRDLRRRLRIATAQTPAPQLNTEEVSGSMTPAFDVYQPNAHFAKSCPGPPDFAVAVTHYRDSAVPFAHWHQLVSQSTVPLKIAAVSEAGTVLVFGVTSAGVPDRNAPLEAKNQSADPAKHGVSH